ncbi:MAG: S46 family peptidase, partial [Phycisphaerales bacterium]
MWTFENPPLAYLEKEYGFKPDQEWLNSLRLGSLRLGGEDILSGFGSASFVSPKGLIMTSTRCVRDAVASTRPGDLNIINTGFVAAALEQEIRLRSSHDEWLTAAQLNKSSNVTGKVNKGVAHTDNETQIKERREANKRAILDAARKADPKLVPQIVSLYQGGIFQLYQYRVYDDVRLVVTPHVQAADFGGDPDNLTYPRHSIDFAFLRAYEDGKPADTTKHYFKWKAGGAKKGELVFVSGNPGTTKRLLTKAQLAFERDIKIPMQMEWITNRLRIWKEDGGGLSHWAFFRTKILGLENGLKAARGNLNGLKD